MMGTYQFFRKHNKFIISKMSKDLLQTHNFPLNKSISKQLYSFPKSNRFEPAKESLCIKGFYDINKSAFAQRTTSFGYGNKMDLVNREPVPPVGKYQLHDLFSKNKEKNRGYSFCKDKNDASINPEKQFHIPGPGTYDHKRQKSAEKYSTLSYSLGSKLEDPLIRHRNTLGPGQYESIPALNPTGNYFVSKYSSSGCRKIGKAQRKLIDDISITPGPGKYEQKKISLNNTGVYFYSKFKNMQASRFGRSNRPSLADTKPVPVPGPGAYGNFSQFAAINRSWMRTSTAGK